MREWTHEHTATLDYQTTYFSELNPARLPLMLARQGLQAQARVRVGQLHMQFLAFRDTGLQLPHEWAQALATRLHAAGVHLVRDGGVPLTELTDMVAPITELAQAFQREELPLLQKLQCVA